LSVPLRVYSRSKMKFDELAATVSPTEREILTAVWALFVRSSKWPSRLRLYRDFGQAAVDALEARRPQLMIFRYEGNDPNYQVTFLGLLLTKTAPEIESVLIRYLEICRQRFLDDPDNRSIPGGELQRQLKLDAGSLRMFLELIETTGLGHWGGTRDSPTITLPDRVYEIPEHDVKSYIRSEAIRRAELWEREFGVTADQVDVVSTAVTAPAATGTDAPTMLSKISRFVRKIWHDPVGSKVIAGGIGTILTGLAWLVLTVWPGIRPWHWWAGERSSSELFYDDQEQRQQKLNGAEIILTRRPPEGSTRCWPHVWATLPGIPPDRFAVCGVWMKRPDSASDLTGFGATSLLFVDLSRPVRQDSSTCPHADERPEPPYVVTLICAGGIKQEPSRWVLPFFGAAPIPENDLKVRLRFEYPKNGRAQASFTLHPANLK
jgi:hypothetical protein